jgi:hypothetical protein
MRCKEWKTLLHPVKVKKSTEERTLEGATGNGRPFSIYA